MVKKLERVRKMLTTALSALECSKCYVFFVKELLQVLQVRDKLLLVVTVVLRIFELG